MDLILETPVSGGDDDDDVDMQQCDSYCESKSEKDRNVKEHPTTH